MSDAARNTRRPFLSSTLGAVAGSLATPQIVPASALGHGATAPSDRVAVGIIGAGGRGVFESRQYIPFDWCEIVAVCDVQESRRTAAKALFEKLYAERKPVRTYQGIRMYNDFRDLLGRKDIDAVYIATADHWHVPITIAAVKAGKDCHTEKPLGVSVEQDLAALRAVRKYGRVFQYGTEQRSAPDARHAVELLLNGRIGKVQKIYVVAPGSETGGSPTPLLPIPKGLDYDLWLGPAPEAPFCHDRCLGEGQRNGIFHIYDYAIGFIAGWAGHPLDLVQWWADHSDLTIPVTYEGTGKLPTEGLFNGAYQWDLRCTYENGLVLHFMDTETFRKQPDAPRPNVGRGVDFVHNAAIFIGTEGWVAIAHEKVTTEPASLMTSEIGPTEIHLHKNSIAGQPGLPQGHQQSATAVHHQDWMQSIKARKDPVSPIESAVRSDLISHLSDICIRTGRPIRWHRAAAVLLLPWLVQAAVLRAAEPDLRIEPLAREIQREVKSEKAMEYMHRVYSTDRWFTFPKFQATAEYLERTLKEIGLSEVELLGAPADGVTQYGFWTMPLAWDAKRARLEIIEPVVPENLRVLADYGKIPTSLGMWSGPTPPGGVTAEVVEMTSDSPKEWEKLDMKGKLVMTRPNLLTATASLKWILVKKGALGAINAFTENPDLKDGRHWVNFWGDSGWAFTKASTPLLCFSVSPRQSDLLHKLLAERGRVRVKAAVETRYYSGKYPYVTGVLRGASGGEEVLELGHTSEQGASDNATGVAAMLEALAALNRLITAGRLPRPQRSIRILAMGEMYPSMHYVATHQERMRNTVAAICVDTAAGPYDLAGTEYAFHLNPDVARSYVDSLIVRVAETYFSHLTPPRPFHVRPYHTGTDEYLPDPTIGIPTITPTGGSGVLMHHNSEDTPERVDARSLRDLTVVTAAFLYSVAASGEAQIPWLAEMAADRGYRQILQASAPTLDRLLTARQGSELGRLLGEGLERIAYAVDRESQGVQSVLRLVPENRRSTFQGRLEPLVERLRHFGEEQSDRVRDAASRQAATLGVTTPVRPASAAVDAQSAEAARIVVKRKRFGTIPMDDLPVEQWEGYPYGSWDLVPVTALYWCDGRRNLAEVIRLTRMEHDSTGFDFDGYFRLLARHGYVEIITGDTRP